MRRRSRLLRGVDSAVFAAPHESENGTFLPSGVHYLVAIGGKADLQLALVNRRE